MKSILSLGFMLFVIAVFGQDNNEKIVVSKDGDSTKVTVFYDSGEIFQEGYYANELPDGKWVSYSKKGEVISIGNYDSGIKEGKWFIWNNQNSSLMEIDFERNKIIRTFEWKDKSIALNEVK